MKNTLFKEVSKLSLGNAEQWVKDAQFLIENDSYGHTYALISFADAEITKAYICWLVAEKIVPSNSKLVEDVFLKHKIKLEILMGLELTPFFQSCL